MDCLEWMVFRDLLEDREPSVFLVSLLRTSSILLVSLESLDTLETRDTSESPETRAVQVFLVTMVCLVLRASLARLDTLEPLDSLDTWEIRDTREDLEEPACLDSPEPLGTLDPLERGLLAEDSLTRSTLRRRLFPLAPLERLLSGLDTLFSIFRATESLPDRISVPPDLAFPSSLRCPSCSVT